jgi:hypothetical protein
MSGLPAGGLAGQAQAFWSVDFLPRSFTASRPPYQPQLGQA